MCLSKKNKISKNTRNRIINSLKREDELDEFTFDLWKNELKRDLPNFWESIGDLKKK